MQKLSNTKLISIATIILSLLLVAKIISLVVWYILPSGGVEYTKAKSYMAKYQRVNFKNMLDKSKKPLSVTEKTDSKGEVVASNIKNLFLKGLYGNKHTGYAIVGKYSKPEKTEIVGVGESFAGYKLKEIYPDKVIFTRGGKDFQLVLKNSTKTPSVNKVLTRVKTPVYEGEHKVTRKDINTYAAHPEKIWKDIGIKAYKKKGKIVGFIVTRIKRNSKMAELGLQKGDIMIRANNVDLTSPNDAINLYKNIKKIDTLQLVVLRDNQEKEIIYEIR